MKWNDVKLRPVVIITVSYKIDLTVKSSGEQLGSLTISIGAANLRVEDNSESWFERADKLLYSAKSGGRNRAMVERQNIGWVLDLHHVSRGRHSKRSQGKPRRPSHMDSMGIWITRHRQGHHRIGDCLASTASETLTRVSISLLRFAIISDLAFWLNDRVL